MSEAINKGSFAQAELRRAKRALKKALERAEKGGKVDLAKFVRLEKKLNKKIKKEEKKKVPAMAPTPGPAPMALAESPPPGVITEPLPGMEMLRRIRQRYIMPFPQRRQIFFRPEVKPEISPRISPEFNPRVNVDLKPRIEPEIAPQIAPEIRPEIRPEIAPRIEPEFKPSADIDFKPRVEPEFKPDFSPRFSFKVERPVRKVREIFKEKRVTKKQEPVIFYMEEVPERSFIDDVFQEISNRTFGFSKYQYKPKDINKEKTVQYTSTAVVNAGKLHNVADVSQKDKEVYAPKTTIPLLPSPPIPNVYAYSYVPESEIVLAPVARLKVGPTEIIPIPVTTQQVMQFINTLLEEPEPWW
jgi:hypothetical protein